MDRPTATRTPMPWTRERRARVRWLIVRKRLSAAAVAERLGVSRDAVAALARRHGWARPRRPKAAPRPRRAAPGRRWNGFWTEALDSELIRLYGREGRTAENVAARLGAPSPAAVAARAARLGLVRSRATAGENSAWMRRAWSPDLPPDGFADAIMGTSDSRPVRIGDADFCGCRAPIAGQGCETWFCGAPIARGSYCGPHDRQFHLPPPTEDLEKVLRRFL